MDHHKSNPLILVDDLASETPSPSESATTNKKEFSNVWNFFTKIGKDEDGIEKAACKYCGNSYKVGKNPVTKNNYGTSHLSRHVHVCRSIANLGVDLNQEGKFGTRKINQKIHRKLLARAIIKHSLPYNFVEYEGIREWIKYINPNVDMKCRNTTVSDVEKEYIEQKDKVKQIMSRIPNRICLTSDVWTAVTSEGYICLTAHFVDENWKLTSKILNFCRMKPPHTGVELESVVFDCLKQLGIDKKIFSITLDNASANTNLQDILKSHLSVHRNLLCDGEFFHVRCCAHTLNLIVQDGLKVIDKALHSIRESIKYVKSSDGRTLKFKECVSDAGKNMSIGLRLDVTTRWNSTYLMLESAIKYKEAFEILKVVDRNYKNFPSSEEWDRGEKICQFLEPFYEITNMMSGSSYPTSNLYFMQIWKIQLIIEENLLNEDVILKDMACNMKEKFQKYWKEYSIGLAFGVILDPRLKVDFITYCYKKLDPLTYAEKTKKVLEKFKRLFKEYVKNFSTSSVSLSQSPTESILMSQSNTEGKKFKRSRIISDFKMYQNESKSIIGKNEIDVYLDEPTIDDDEDSEDFDVLKYWKTNEKKFAILSIMARDVFSVPITTVASESAFSKGGRVLSKYRSFILPEHVQMLICTQNWLYGFSENPSDEIVEDIFGHEGIDESKLLEDVESLQHCGQ